MELRGHLLQLIEVPQLAPQRLRNRHQALLLTHLHSRYSEMTCPNHVIIDIT